MSEIEYVQTDWIPQMPQEEHDKLHAIINEASSGQQVLNTIDRTVVRVEAVRKLMEDRSVSTEVVDAYGRIMQSRYTRRLCKVFPVSFFECLYNPMGSAPYRSKAQFDKDKARGYTSSVNIFEYQVLLIPVLLKDHWTLLTVDTKTRQVRFVDTDGDGGIAYMLAIRRWLAREWK
jgi:Ulp1 family protease